MTTLPCKNCITFSMCKIRYFKSINDYNQGTLSLINARRNLSQHCSIISDWLYKITDHESFNKKLRKLHKEYLGEQFDKYCPHDEE